MDSEEPYRRRILEFYLVKFAFIFMKSQKSLPFNKFGEFRTIHTAAKKLYYFPMPEAAKETMKLKYFFYYFYILTWLQKVFSMLGMTHMMSKKVQFPNNYTVVIIQLTPQKLCNVICVMTGIWISATSRLGLSCLVQPPVINIDFPPLAIVSFWPFIGICS